jgi:NADH:ubiquinone oxidoreductase subunit 3 (subunit A)
MLEEALVAFILIFISTMIIYILGRRSAPKTTISDNAQAAYACGENAVFPGLKINVSLYKYLIYFVIFDSSVLVLAFSVFSIAGTTNPLLLILYLGIILAAGLVIVEGGKDK